MDPGWVLIHLLEIPWCCCCFNEWLLWQKLVFGAIVVVDSGAVSKYPVATPRSVAWGINDTPYIIHHASRGLQCSFMILERAER